MGTTWKGIGYVRHNYWRLPDRQKGVILMMQEFVQQIEETAKSVMNEIHTALPGKIVSVNPQKGTAQIKPYGKYVMRDGKKLEYPELTEVPLVFPFSPAAGTGMVFPVKAEDSCLVILSEVELDEWRSGAETEAPLRYDLTNAIAIPGLLSAGQALVEKACTQNAVVVCGKFMVEGEVVFSGNLKVEGNVTASGNLEAGGNITTSGNITGGNIYGHVAGQ